MSDEELRVRQAQHAQRILEDEMIKSAIDQLRADAMAEFMKAQPGDVDALSQARMKYDLTEQFIGKFNSIVRDGQVAQSNLDRASGNRH